MTRSKQGSLFRGAWKPCSQPGPSHVCSESCMPKKEVPQPQDMPSLSAHSRGATGISKENTCPLGDSCHAHVGSSAFRVASRSRTWAKGSRQRPCVRYTLRDVAPRSTTGATMKSSPRANWSWIVNVASSRGSSHHMGRAIGVSVRAARSASTCSRSKTCMQYAAHVRPRQHCTKAFTCGAPLAWVFFQLSQHMQSVQQISYPHAMRDSASCSAQQLRRICASTVGRQHIQGDLER